MKRRFGPKSKLGICLLLFAFTLSTIHSSIAMAQQGTKRAEVTIEGDVNKPGNYLYSPDQRIKDLILDAEDLTSEAYMLEGTLYRTDPVTGEVTTLTFDVAKAIQGDPENNMVLEELDRVVIHSEDEGAAAAGMTAAGEAAEGGITKKTLVIGAIVAAAAVGLIIALDDDDDDIPPTTEHP